MVLSNKIYKIFWVFLLFLLAYLFIYTIFYLLTYYLICAPIFLSSVNISKSFIIVGYRTDMFLSEQSYSKDTHFT